MRFYIRILFFLSFSVSLLNAAFQEKEWIQRINSHMTIGDHASALKESIIALEEHPSSDILKEAYIRSLAENGKDDEAVLRLKKWKSQEINPGILEALAWGVLHRSENSKQVVVNIASLVGAFYTQDVRAVQMLKNQMQSPNAFLRAMSVQLATHYRDEVLIEEVKRLLYDETVWYVRLEVIKALGVIGTKEVEEPLKKIVMNPRSTVEEKGVAIGSLVQSYQVIAHEELQELVKSHRSGLRHLACQVIAHLDLIEEIPMLTKLLEDSCIDVQIAALSTLHLLGLHHLSEKELEKIHFLMDHPNATLSITAAFIALDYSHTKAVNTLKKWVVSEEEKTRRLAALALGQARRGSEKLIFKIMHQTADPFVKANLALGLIRRETALKRAAGELDDFLNAYEQNIMWCQGGHPSLQYLASSELSHTGEIPQYPAMVDRYTRLDILNYLAILKHPRAKEAVKSFLRNKIFGVSFAASTTLLEEEGEEALMILRELLQDEDDLIRIQSALVLALSGSEPEAISHLQSVYPRMDREMKINILGAIGHVGDQQSIPFLVKELEESHQILRVMVASALIQCLYH